MQKKSLLIASRTRVLQRTGWLLIAAVIFWLLFTRTGFATPPDYQTFGRLQRSDYAHCDKDLLRIWVVYAGQGDGMLIQLPKKYNYDPDDGVDALLMLDILQTLYDFSRIHIENAIITLHDSDPVRGLTAILNKPSFSAGTIYHNGPASYRYSDGTRWISAKP